MTMDRNRAIDAFLSDQGWGAAQRKALAGDASNRRYERLSDPVHGPAVLMDAPPEKGEDVRPFLHITQVLRGLGFSAPEILAADEALGLLLLEDLGDALFARQIASGNVDERVLYSAAVDLLADLHAREIPEGAAAQIPPYDRATVLREAQLATHWYGRAIAPGADEAGFDRLIGRLCAEIAEARSVLVLRDYHAENLLWLPERLHHQRVGLLDYQDALIGHPAYDLVSLLEDARRDVAPSLAEVMIERFLAERPELDEAAFRRDYAILGAQRNLKIVGIFARLWLRDGKPRYLDLIPRVWGYLERDLAHPELGELRAWVAQNLPPPTPAVLDALRATPPGLEAKG